jgi:hypothetical protein
VEDNLYMDDAELQFHIEANDFFGTLATVVDLVAQSLKKKGTSREIAALGRVRDQLMYLQRDYRIERVGLTAGSENLPS